MTCSDDNSLAVIDKAELLRNEQYRPKHLAGHTKAVNRVAPMGSDAIWSVSRDLSIKLVESLLLYYCS